MGRMRTLLATTKGDLAEDAYLRGDYKKANLSEMQFALLSYASKYGLPVTDSLKQYGTEGTAAIEQLIEEGKLRWKEPIIESNFMKGA
jgi:hypothetical protein